MEKKRKSKIKKWDEVSGMVETEVEEVISDPSEDSIISRNQNPLRAVEDTLEQNDNSLDGIINNMPEVKPAAQMTNEDVIKDEQKKKSILKDLQDSTPKPEVTRPTPVCKNNSERERK